LKERTKDLVEILGIFGLIASLLFVGLQMMLDRRIAMGNQFHQRNVLSHDAARTVFDSEKLLEYQADQYENGFRPDWWSDDLETFKTVRNMTGEGLVMQIALARMFSYRVNNNFYQHKLGLIDPENWDRVRKVAQRAIARDPITRAVLLSDVTLEPELRELAQQGESAVEGNAPQEF